MSLPSFSWWLIPAVVGGVVVAFLVLLFFVALFEKRPVHAYSPTPLPVLPSDFAPYVTAMNDAAHRAGFTHGGVYPHSKGGMYHTWLSLWLSPDRYILVNIVGGTTLNMAYRVTTLWTPTPDGRYLVTRDEVDSGDPSGLLDVRTVLNAGFDELLAAHVRRLGERGPYGIVPLAEPTPLEAWREIERRLVAPTIERGVGRWLDADHTNWAYSVKGALLLCTVTFFGGALKSMGQTHRAWNPRPGARPPSGGFDVIGAPAAPPPPRSDRDFLP